MAKEQKDKEKEVQAVKRLQQRDPRGSDRNKSQSRLLEVIASLEGERERTLDEVQVQAI